MENKSQTKLDRFLLIRGFSCLVVFLSHIPFWKYLDQDSFFAKVLVFNGRAAVTIFFVLSGYLITKQFLSGKYSLNLNGIKAFWAVRAKRIIPTTYLSILFCIIINYDVLLTKAGLIKLFQSLIFYFDVDSQPEFMLQLWSLSAEVQFYILIPFVLYFLNSKLKNIRGLAIFGVVLFAGNFLFRRFAVAVLEEFQFLNQFRHFGLHVFFLMFGVFTAYFERFMQNYQTLKLNQINIKLKKYSSQLFWFLLALNFVSIWIIKIVYKFNSFDVLWFSWVQVILVGVMIFVGQINNTQVSKLSLDYFSSNAKQKLINFSNDFGILSFAFYLVHLTIIHKVVSITNNIWITALISFVLSYIVSIGIHRISNFIATKK
jgi:peptidoglycan/LPS O-acetylase OafA/YrhL